MPPPPSYPNRGHQINTNTTASCKVNLRQISQLIRRLRWVFCIHHWVRGFIKPLFVYREQPSHLHSPLRVRKAEVGSYVFCDGRVYRDLQGASVSCWVPESFSLPWTDGLSSRSNVQMQDPQNQNWQFCHIYKDFVRICCRGNLKNFVDTDVDTLIR